MLTLQQAKDLYLVELNKLSWRLVADQGGWKLYDVYQNDKFVASLLFGRQREGWEPHYRVLLYDKGATYRCRDLVYAEMMLAAPFLNPNC